MLNEISSQNRLAAMTAVASAKQNTFQGPETDFELGGTSRVQKIDIVARLKVDEDGLVEQIRVLSEQQPSWFTHLLSQYTAYHSEKSVSYGREMSMDPNWAKYQLQKRAASKAVVNVLKSILSSSEVHAAYPEILREAVDFSFVNAPFAEAFDVELRDCLSVDGQGSFFNTLANDVINDAENGEATKKLRKIVARYVLTCGSSIEQGLTDGTIDTAEDIPVSGPYRAFQSTVGDLLDQSVHGQGNVAYDAAKKVGVLLEALRIATDDYINDVNKKLDRRLDAVVTVANILTIYGSAGDLLGRRVGSIFAHDGGTYKDARRLKSLIKLANQRYGSKLFRRKHERYQLDYAQDEVSQVWQNNLDEVRSALQQTDVKDERQGGNRLWDAFQMGTLLINTNGY